jgi:hypothetical protein
VLTEHRAQQRSAGFEHAPEENRRAQSSTLLPFEQPVGHVEFEHNIHFDHVSVDDPPRPHAAFIIPADDWVAQSAALI